MHDPVLLSARTTLDHYIGAIIVQTNAPSSTRHQHPFLFVCPSEIVKNWSALLGNFPTFDSNTPDTCSFSLNQRLYKQMLCTSNRLLEQCLYLSTSKIPGICNKDYVHVILHNQETGWARFALSAVYLYCRFTCPSAVHQTNQSHVKSCRNARSACVSSRLACLGQQHAFRNQCAAYRPASVG
jgi:hypothetical protein